jgi:hypothetical protein
MDTGFWIGTALTAFAVVVGLIFNIISQGRTKKGDSVTEGRQSGIILTELGYVKSGIDGLSRKMEQQENRYVDFTERIALVESSTKQAQHRIDEHIQNQNH